MEMKINAETPNITWFLSFFVFKNFVAKNFPFQQL